MAQFVIMAIYWEYCSYWHLANIDFSYIKDRSVIYQNKLQYSKISGINNSYSKNYYFLGEILNDFLLKFN